jgi:hypothetical protein
MPLFLPGIALDRLILFLLFPSPLPFLSLDLFLLFLPCCSSSLSISLSLLFLLERFWPSFLFIKSCETSCRFCCIQCRARTFVSVGQRMQARGGNPKQINGSYCYRFSNQRFDSNCIFEFELREESSWRHQHTFMAFVQEKARISRFRFMRDSKLALVGRLLLHAAATSLLQPGPDEKVVWNFCVQDFIQ